MKLRKILVADHPGQILLIIKTTRALKKKCPILKGEIFMQSEAKAEY